jgi:alpha-ketoglutarate-dependent taurine dioxygenase
VPPAGGDTEFASMYLAYETLSDGLKRVLEGLNAVNSSAAADVSRTREDRIKDSARADAKKEYVAAHPVVRVHPETGRPALYVNSAHTIGFEGMTQAESAPLLQYLFRWQVRPEVTCRFRWQAGSIAMWDNRCAQHNAINDYQGHRRLMHRITLAGDIPK